MEQKGGAVGEMAREAVGVLADVTTSQRPRRLNGSGFVLLCASLLVAGLLGYSKLQDARAWKQDTEERLHRIEIKVDALLIMKGANPQAIAQSPRPSSTGPFFDLLGDASADESPRK